MTSMTTDSISETDAAPEAEPTFDDLPLTEEVRRAVDECGWGAPTPVQLACFEPMAAGRDLIVQARTGTGKTAAFGLPLVDKIVRPDVPGVQALILAPTRELALQSQREIARLGKHRGIDVAAVYGGAPMDPQVRQLRGGAHVVSGTPGRVLDHLRRGTLDPSGLRCLVLDEADEILSMGFAKELGAIIELLPKDRQTLFFSATAEGEVEHMAERHMRDHELISLSSDAVGAATISHYIYMVTGKARELDLVRVLEVEDPESAIIFCNTKAETERVAAFLQQRGFNADWLNGDLPQSERERVMARTRSGELRYLVATDVAARGIDVSHLTHVINYELPETPEQYIHRTGRTGRAGRTGTAIGLVSPAALGTLYFIRLTYKIFPVERSLPTAGEERTRREADRISMLEEAFARVPSEQNLSLARRLLTHPEAERLLAGLLREFFGSKGDDEQVDEQAAAARRARPAAPVAAVPTSEPAAQTRSEPATEPSVPRRRRRPRSEAPEETPREGLRRPAREADEDHTNLYMNVGRRDGLRPGEVTRFFCEEANLDRGDIGKIRIRDKHTFVGIPSQKAASVIEALSGKSLRDQELVIEVAKSEQ